MSKSRIVELKVEWVKNEDQKSFQSKKDMLNFINTRDNLRDLDVRVLGTFNV